MLIKKFRKQSTAAGIDAAAACAWARPPSDHASTPLAGFADVCVKCVPASFLQGIPQPHDITQPRMVYEAG